MATQNNGGNPVEATAAPTPLLLTIVDAAALLGIPNRTLWILINKKLVQAVRVGGKWYLQRHVIERLAAEGCPGPDTDSDPAVPDDGPPEPTTK